MQPLRKPFFIAAVWLILLTVLLETGSGFLLPAGKEELKDQASKVDGITQELVESINIGSSEEPKRPPGIGISFMAFLDGLLLLTVGLMASQFFIGERVQGRIQGIVSMVVSCLVLLAAIASIFLTIAKLLLMVGLFIAFPFGTICYLAIWGFFNKTGASAALGLLLMLKLGFGACLVLAHQRFLQNKGLVLIIISSLLANLIVGFFHALVPRVLVSITDAIAGIVVLVLAAAWAVFLLIGSVTSVRRAIV